MGEELMPEDRIFNNLKEEVQLLSTKYDKLVQDIKKLDAQRVQLEVELYKVEGGLGTLMDFIKKHDINS